jgi:NitT/TauT family transport system ATP-binding protein
MRGSIARALYSRPEIVFLDEPFSALDGITRRSVQTDFVTVARAEGWTVLMVTDDLTEALGIADRVIALRGQPAKVVVDRRRGEVDEGELVAVLGGAE